MLKEIAETSLKSIFSLGILFVLARLMGKKQLSHLSFFDYVAGISIGSIAANFAIESSVSYTKGITSLIIYALFPILFSYVGMKSYRGRKLLDGEPTVLIQNGKILEKNLVKTKLNINDLLEECRLKDVFNIEDIAYAILETNGKLSVQLNTSAQKPTRKDMKIVEKEEGLCTNLIIDGRILDDHLNQIGKNRIWLTAELKKQGEMDVQSILLAYLNTQKKLIVHKKETPSSAAPLL